jgi:hypothetical protein
MIKELPVFGMNATLRKDRLILGGNPAHLPRGIKEKNQEKYENKEILVSEYKEEHERNNPN